MKVVHLGIKIVDNNEKSKLSNQISFKKILLKEKISGSEGVVVRNIGHIYLIVSDFNTLVEMNKKNLLGNINRKVVLEIAKNPVIIDAVIPPKIQIIEQFLINKKYRNKGYMRFFLDSVFKEFNLDTYLWCQPFDCEEDEDENKVHMELMSKYMLMGFNLLSSQVMVKWQRR